MNLRAVLSEPEEVSNLGFGFRIVNADRSKDAVRLQSSNDLSACKAPDNVKGIASNLAD